MKALKCKKSILTFLLLGLFFILSGYSVDAVGNYNIDIYLDLREGDKYLGSITNPNGSISANIYIKEKRSNYELIHNVEIYSVNGRGVIMIPSNSYSLDLDSLLYDNSGQTINIYFEGKSRDKGMMIGYIFLGGVAVYLIYKVHDFFKVYPVQN